MGIEHTLAIIKPDVLLQKSQHYDSILKIIQQHNFQIVRKKRWTLSKEEAEAFYGEHSGKFFYQRLVSFITSGPVEAIILKRDNAIQGWRSIMGPTHIAKSKLQPETIRAQFAFSDTRNVVHGSDSIESALKEIQFFFPHFKAE